MPPKRVSGAAQRGSGARPRTEPEGGTSGGAAAPAPAAQKRKAATARPADAAHKLAPVPLEGEGAAPLAPRAGGGAGCTPRIA